MCAIVRFGVVLRKAGIRAAVAIVPNPEDQIVYNPSLAKVIGCSRLWLSDCLARRRTMEMLLCVVLLFVHWPLHEDLSVCLPGLLSLMKVLALLAAFISHVSWTECHIIRISESHDAHHKFVFVWCVVLT